MKILSASQLREADAFTVSNEPVKSVDLMERAAQACADEIKLFIKKDTPVFIFCGPGNNGGDGLAITRQLFDLAYDVEVFILDFSTKFSADFTLNLQRIKERGIIPKFLSETAIPEFSPGILIIDSIFGTGLRKEPEGRYAEVIQYINKQSEKGNKIISIDLPSGLFDEENDLKQKKSIIKADFTLTFQFPKLSFLFPENDEFVGEWKVLDIKLHPEFIKEVPTHYFFVNHSFVKGILKERKRFSHKGNYGHSLIIAGGYGKTGAAVLSSKACLRSGTGLLTVHIPKTSYSVLQTSVPEAMVSIDRDEKIVSELTKIEKYSAIGAGPGLGMEKDTQNVIKLLIQNVSRQLILDADALNILSENKTWCSFLPSNTILTPHPKEFEQLAGKASTAYERLKMAIDFSKKFNVIVILKGRYSAICTPSGNTYFNSTGNPGMATGGTGDVLTGIITGLAAQGYSAIESSLLGVFVHGLAADFASEVKGEHSLIAGDIIDFLPEAFNNL